MPGVFYPLIVAALLAVAATLGSLREDVAVLKVRVDQLDKILTARRRQTDEDPVPASTWQRGVP